MKQGTRCFPECGGKSASSGSLRLNFSVSSVSSFRAWVRVTVSCKDRTNQVLDGSERVHADANPEPNVRTCVGGGRCGAHYRGNEPAAKSLTVLAESGGGPGGIRTRRRGATIS